MAHRESPSIGRLWPAATSCSISMSKGREKIKSAYPAAVAVFVLPPSLAELARRLSMRGTEDRQVIQRRLANARGEIAAENPL